MPLRGLIKEPREGSPADPAHVVERACAALESEPRVNAIAHPLELAFEEGTMTVAGELAEVAAKTRALELVQTFPEVRRVVDRITVRPAARMGDGELRDHLRNALLGEPTLQECRLVLRAEGVEDRAQDPAPARGAITVSVEEGIVTFEGNVPSLSHARLAGVLAWWIPGTRDVRNRLRATPPEEDTDEELNDAVRIVLEKEPLVDAAQLAVRTTGGRVTLFGTVRSEELRQIAERDAWYVSGVREVVNRIQVQVS